MALIKELKGSFVGGKVSKPLQNRTDLEKFNTWLTEAKNTQIKPEGSISNRAGTVFIGTTKDSTYRLTINVDVSSTIIINGEVYKNVTTKSVDLEVGSEYSYSVGASGYEVKSGSGTLNNNKTVDLELTASADSYTFTIDNGEQGATITINGAEQSSITASEGTLVEWLVEKTGYVSQSGVSFLTKDETKEVILEAGSDTVTIAITAYPSNAVIQLIINEEDTYTGTGEVSAEVEIGDTYRYTVLLEGYATVNDSGEITESVSITEALQVERASVSNISTETTEDPVTSLFRYNINRTGQFSIDIKAETGVQFQNGTPYYGDGWQYSATSKGGTAVGTISLTAGQVVDIKAIKGGYESFNDGGVNYKFVGGCGIGVWIDNLLVLVVGGGALWTSDYWEWGYCMGGGGYNGGIAKFNGSRKEEWCGYSYNGVRGNNTTDNAGSGGKAQASFGGSGYVHNDYSSYFTLTKDINQAKASASITFVG